MSSISEYASDVAKDGTKFNTILCVVAIIFIIFVGGEFALILPAWMWMLLGIALIAFLLRSTVNSD